ncbi:hypothetical protein ARAM_003968 [Aspergillus rambellii]|uniref:Uncharacterized protein n=1 Tax=Aspergillus rambellii TaxID=308745 RepID=A0A0F8XIQ2_9EURO|nr:hypothetical protein ARAM_003968 [Aspergillus rambellii]
MSDISFFDLKEREQERDNSLRRKTSKLSKIKQHLRNIKREWGPLLAAKENWDDDDPRSSPESLLGITTLYPVEQTRVVYEFYDGSYRGLWRVFVNSHLM